MHDRKVVHVIEGKEELLHHMAGLVLSEGLKLTNLGEKVATVDDLHDDVVIPAIFHQLKYASDMRMNGILKHLKLILVEILVDLVDLKRALLDNLDGTRCLGCAVHTKVDRAESSCAHFLPLGVLFVEFGYFLKLHLLFVVQEIESLILLLLLGKSSLLLDKLGFSHARHIVPISRGE